MQLVISRSLASLFSWTIPEQKERLLTVYCQLDLCLLVPWAVEKQWQLQVGQFNPYFLNILTEFY